MLRFWPRAYDYTLISTRIGFGNHSKLPILFCATMCHAWKYFLRILVSIILCSNFEVGNSESRDFGIQTKAT